MVTGVEPQHLQRCISGYDLIVFLARSDQILLRMERTEFHLAFCDDSCDEILPFEFQTSPPESPWTVQASEEATHSWEIRAVLLHPGVRRINPGREAQDVSRRSIQRNGDKAEPRIKLAGPVFALEDYHQRTRHHDHHCRWGRVRSGGESGHRVDLSRVLPGVYVCVEYVS